MTTCGVGTPQLLHLLDEILYAERNAVADDVDDILVEYAGRKLVKRKFAVIVDDGVTGVRATLKADDDVAVIGEDVGDLALAFVAPVGAYDCFYHGCFSLLICELIR